MIPCFSVGGKCGKKCPTCKVLALSFNYIFQIYEILRASMRVQLKKIYKKLKHFSKEFSRMNKIIDKNKIQVFNNINSLTRIRES